MDETFWAERLAESEGDNQQGRGKKEWSKRRESVIIDEGKSFKKGRIEPVAQRQEMVINTLALLWYFKMVAVM